MLQTVLGIDAARIASAFLVAPATMSQRLVRAKKKITAAAIPFETPAAGDLPARADAVLDSIYAAFGAGYDDDDAAVEDAGVAVKGLAPEAIYLGALASALLPQNAEAHGLVALMNFIHARRSARRRDGRYVTLADQDTTLWNAAMIETANMSLALAASLRRPGRVKRVAAVPNAHDEATNRS
jgi:RNA polymerase sigma-70 factor (ECF subfamily)